MLKLDYHHIMNLSIQTETTEDETWTFRRPRDYLEAFFLLEVAITRAHRSTETLVLLLGDFRH